MAEAMLPGFISPCLPTKAKEPPCGGLWWHEIKHDGFRIIARKDGSRVRLYSRNGRDFTHRFALIVDAWQVCARAPASSTGRRSPAGTTGCQASTGSATGGTTPSRPLSGHRPATRRADDRFYGSSSSALDYTAVSVELMFGNTRILSTPTPQEGAHRCSSNLTRLQGRSCST
jgi:hypothetical protein